MARQVNETSNRQMVFARLDNMVEVPRKDALAAIVSEFELNTSYARTLYQQHRARMIESRILVETFAVREKDGKPTIITRHRPVKTFGEGEHPTAKKALSVYKRGLEARLRATEKLQEAI